MITRSEIAHRQGTVWQPGTVPYSQTTWASGPYGAFRADCSGYVSGTLGLTWSYDTVGLVKLCDPISPNDLLRGDLIGLMLPGDDGHVMSFEAWTEDGLIIWEQAGGTVGQTRRTIDAIPAGYSCYRYNGIEEEAMTPSEQEQFNDLIWRQDAAASGSLTIRGGRYDGEPYQLNVTLASIQDQLREVLNRLNANTPEHTHTVPAGQTGPATGA